MISLVRQLEQWTLPSPTFIRWEGGALRQETFRSMQKVKYYVKNLFLCLGTLLAVPPVLLYSLLRKLSTCCFKYPEKPASSSPQSEISFADFLPRFVGFASSLFQDSGVGSKFSATKGLSGRNQWDPWLTPKHIDNTKPEDFPRFFVDVLGSPDTCSGGLAQMGATAHRLSFEWANLQPKMRGDYCPKAIAAYKETIAKLKANGVEPFITLHHFTHPDWFEKEGAFTKKENCDLFIKYARDMMSLFPEVRYWYTFNEIGAFTLEGLLGDHPSPIKNINDAGLTLRNMLMTHCQIYKLKEEFPNAQIGLTHQWLKLTPINGNPLEKIVCDLATKVAHTAIFRFFQTGIFSFQVAGRSNLHFSIPKKEFLSQNRFLDYIGVQYYGPAYIVLGSNKGSPYPGHRISNFTLGPFGASFGGTAPRGKRVMSFGPTEDPKAFAQNLEEAISLGRPVHISEIGVDAKTQKHGGPFRIDELRQKKIFKKYKKVLAPYTGKITAFFAWTLHGQFEWNRGHQAELCVGKFEADEETRKIIRYRPRPLGKWLQKHFLRVRERNRNGFSPSPKRGSAPSTPLKGQAPLDSPVPFSQSRAPEKK